MAKKPVATKNGTTIFSEVAEKITSERVAKPRSRFSIVGPKKVEAHYVPLTTLDPQSDLTGVETITTEMHRGAELMMTFDSVENLQRFVDATHSPGTGAWKRMAHLLRVAQDDEYIKNSAVAVDFLKLVEQLAETVNGEGDPHKILAPVFEKFRSISAKNIRKARTDKGSALVKKKALSLYQERGWVSVAAAARGIFCDVNEYANSLTPKQEMSEPRFEKTLRGWIKEQQN